MIIATKLTENDVEEIKKQLQQGKTTAELAKKYNVHQSTIQKGCKDALKTKKHSIEVRNKVLKKIKQGYSKAEVGIIYGVSPHTVLFWTKGIPGYKYAGDQIMRKHGIELLNRLLLDGYLISNFVVATARGLQKHFPVILSARYRDKTFFYLKGREEEAIEAFFREKPDRIISYSAIEEMSYLLGVKISNKDQYKLFEKFKKKHNGYWESRRLIQHSLDDWIDEPQSYEIGFRLFPKEVK